MRIAARTHDFGKKHINELAPFLKKEGFDAAQLVLPKAFHKIESYDEITEDHLHLIGESFLEHKIDIQILGCYMDLGNPDEEVRKIAIQNFTNCLKYSKILGAHMVGTETAYPRLNTEDKKIWYGYMMDSLLRITEVAEKEDTLMAIEPVYWHPLEDLETTINVFEKLNSNKVRMIFDPANVLEFPEKVNQAEYWTQWLTAMGDKIDAIHMKDFVLESDRTYQPVVLGEGVMNYESIVKWSKQNSSDIVVVREEIVPKTAQKDISYMRKLWEN